jgi:hypothetical protein
MSNQMAELIMLFTFMFASYPLATFVKKGKWMRVLLSFGIGISLFLMGKQFLFPFL